MSKEAPEISVPIDCCVFDRCVQFLEYVALDKVDKFKIIPNEEVELRSAAKILSCAGLLELCDRHRGTFISRVRKEGISWKEVLKRNKSGECIIYVHGMIFDITRWLPEHPGGNKIIPKQALNKDATRMFEIYHAGPEPFEYLKEFYIGNILPEDEHNVPKSEIPPTSEFLKHLDCVTKWRLPKFTSHKSL